MDKISYALGLQVGQQLSGLGEVSFDYADLAAGIKDMIEKNQPQISLQEAQQARGRQDRYCCMDHFPPALGPHQERY